MHNNPLSRRYQDKFVSLKQELDVIVGILEDQQRVLVALDDSINEGEAKSVIVESLNKLQGREASVIEFCLQSAEETLQNFVEMTRRTSDLESWVSSLILIPLNTITERERLTYSCSTFAWSNRIKTAKRKPLSPSPP